MGEKFSTKSGESRAGQGNPERVRSCGLWFVIATERARTFTLAELYTAHWKLRARCPRNHKPHDATPFQLIRTREGLTCA